MFNSFDGAKSGGPKKTHTEEPKQQSFEASIRPKRQQVARACDSCRMHRVKCDNNVPCKNCLSRGETCVNKSASERRTLPQAYREIERLKQTIKDLEIQLEKERSRPNTVSATFSPHSSVLTPPGSVESVSTPYVHSGTLKPPVWGGVLASTGQSSRKTYYGPSSMFYYIHRMNVYLSSVFQQLNTEDQIQLRSVAKTFATPDCNPVGDEDKPDLKEIGQPVSNEEFLTPSQEEYFLNLFWQSYHTTLVVLDETEFKRHYRSLLTKPGKPRKPSALVDIVIAVSMQVGMALAQRMSQKLPEVGKDDPSIAGRQYYRRCQALLHKEQEAPTIMAVQCHILSAVYTCCAAFQNMCWTALSMALSSAHLLGLHEEPPSDLPLAEQEIRRRVYWALYAFETKVCMKLGRPFYVNLHSTSCNLPAHDHSAASLAGSDFALVDEHTTWLSYQSYNIKLLLAAREVHTAFYDKYPEIISYSGRGSIYDDPEAMERYAEFLAIAMKPLNCWVDSVPNVLKTQRKGGGRPLSLDAEPLVVEPVAPLWLQRQRLLLELLYNVLATNLYRPFISFPKSITSYSSLGSVAQSHAAAAAKHSVMTTRIMHQMVVEYPDLLAGWHEAFQWQWNAALTLTGYLFAHPQSPISPSVREAIDLAIVVFEDFARSFGGSMSGATVTKDLTAKIDFLAEIMQGSDAAQTSAAVPETHIPTPDTGALTISQLVTEAPPAPLPNDLSFTQDLMSGSMQAYAVDNSGDLEMLWPPLGGMSDQWWFPNQPINPNGMSGQFPG
ncbi:hypothetical protein F5Y16DRAFT_371942 [Xylariaceae sp. FL0255]|nr:hypothetical protein F5Y16DRAFT_371942 [Xylariaceae sp. FL0255]